VKPCRAQGELLRALELAALGEDPRQLERGGRLARVAQEQVRESLRRPLRLACFEEQQRRGAGSGRIVGIRLASAIVERHGGLELARCGRELGLAHERRSVPRVELERAQEGLLHDRRGLAGGAQRNGAQLVEHRRIGMGGESRGDASLLPVVVPEECLLCEEHPQHRRVRGLAEVEVRALERRQRRRRTLVGQQQRRLQGLRARRLAGQRGEPRQALRHQRSLAGAMGDPDRYDESFGIVRVGAHVAPRRVEGSHEIACRLVELRQRQSRLRLRGVRPDRFAILGGGALEVPDALRGLSRQEAGRGIVRPETDPGLEGRERGPGIALAEQHPPADQLAQRLILDLLRDSHRLLEALRLRERVRIREAQHRRGIRARRERLLEGIERGIERVALHVVIGEREPRGRRGPLLGRPAQHALLGQGVAARAHPPRERHLQRRAFALLGGIAQDLGRALAPIGAVEEGDRLAHDDGIAGEFRDARLVTGIGGCRVSLLEVEEAARDAESGSRGRRDLVRGLLESQARGLEGDLGLVDALGGKQRQHARHEHEEVGGVEREDAVDVLQRLLRATRGELRLGAQLQGLHVVGGDRQHPIDDRDRVVGGATVEHRPRQQLAGRDRMLGGLRSPAQRPDRKPCFPVAQQCDPEQKMRLDPRRVLVDEPAQRVDGLRKASLLLELADLGERIQVPAAGGAERDQDTGDEGGQPLRGPTGPAAPGGLAHRRPESSPWLARAGPLASRMATRSASGRSLRPSQLRAAAGSLRSQARPIATMTSSRSFGS